MLEDKSRVQITLKKNRKNGDFLDKNNLYYTSVHISVLVDSLDKNNWYYISVHTRAVVVVCMHFLNMCDIILVSNHNVMFLSEYIK